LNEGKNNEQNNSSIWIARILLDDNLLQPERNVVRRNPSQVIHHFYGTDDNVKYYRTNTN